MHQSAQELDPPLTDVVSCGVSGRNQLKRLKHALNWMFLRRKLSDKRFYAFHFIFPSIHISSLTGVAKIPVHACMGILPHIIYIVITYLIKFSYQEFGIFIT